MLLLLVTFCFSVMSALGSRDCGKICDSSETCCPGPSQSETNCCPFENAVCCEDGIHCCPEGSFCDLEIRMCGMFSTPQVLRRRSGDNDDGIAVPADSGNLQQKRRPTLDQSHWDQIADLDHMLSLSEHNQFCPYFTTGCDMKEGVSLCCPNSKGVCCPDGKHCCKKGEECDSGGHVCISDIGTGTLIRVADELVLHFDKRVQHFMKDF